MISSDEEPFIAMGTFCHNWLAQNAIASTPKYTDRGFSDQISEYCVRCKDFSEEQKCKSLIEEIAHVNTYRLLSWGSWCKFYGLRFHEMILVVR